MLSRVADRLYWTSRYLVRSAGTARLLNAYTQFILDIPQGSELGWDGLLKVFDSEQAFDQKYKKVTEHNVLKFLITDLDNPTSLRFSIKAARENVRTTRDVLPEDIWEQVNELYLYAEEMASQSIARKHRFDFLEQIVKRNQQIHGLIESTVSRDHSYTFLKLGRFIEHADIISRVIDVDAATIGEKDEVAISKSSLFWVNLLSSLSANSAYRIEIGPLVDSPEVINFLFKSHSFPRSLFFCMSEIQHILKSLKSSEAAARQVDGMMKILDGFDAEQQSHKQLHDFIDTFQTQINLLHGVINKSWFEFSEQSPVSTGKKDKT